MSKIQKDSNVITSHVLYKRKTLDNSYLQCKARITLHGNRDEYKKHFKTDAQTCPPVGLRILLSICVICNWCFVKIDIKSAFLQSGSAERDVYVAPPRACVKKGFYWPLLTTAYGLVNANAKWQDHSDSFLRELGFAQFIYVPQLLFKKFNNQLDSLAVKVVEGILVSSVKTILDDFVAKVSTKYKVGTIVRGPETFSFFGLSITQFEDGTIRISGEKTRCLRPHLISRLHRKQQEQSLTAVDHFSYSSFNGSLGFIGTSGSQFCAFTTSYFQKRKVSPLVKDLVLQCNLLRHLQKLGSTITFKHPSDTRSYHLKAVSFLMPPAPTIMGNLHMSLELSLKMSLSILFSHSWMELTKVEKAD